MNARLSASFAALLAVALLAGCAKTNEAASTGTDTSASGDAAAPEGEEGSASAEIVPEEEVTPEEAPQE